LLNDPRIKEIRTLLSKLRTEHPKLKWLGILAPLHLNRQYEVSVELVHNYLDFEEEVTVVVWLSSFVAYKWLAAAY
jgi:hypothetical protein